MADRSRRAPERVTHVVMTHLHADHVGWNTTWQDNRWVPTFPNARYYLPKDDFVFCDEGRNKEPGVVDVFGESFFDSVMPVVNEGLAEMMMPGQEIAGCLQVESAVGHSPGQVVFRARSHGEEAIFCGDILHSPLQIVLPQVNSGYCIRPDLARSTRLSFLNQAADSEALILPVHFGEPYCGYVRRQVPASPSNRPRGSNGTGCRTSMAPRACAPFRHTPHYRSRAGGYDRGSMSLPRDQQHAGSL